MTHFPYFRFNQSAEQRRRVGARGGKAQARNRRGRVQLRSLPKPEVLLPPPQTAAQSIAALDAQFPWLCGAEKRRAPKRAQRN